MTPTWLVRLVAAIATFIFVASANAQQPSTLAGSIENADTIATHVGAGVDALTAHGWDSSGSRAFGVLGMGLSLANSVSAYSEGRYQEATNAMLSTLAVVAGAGVIEEMAIGGAVLGSVFGPVGTVAGGYIGAAIATSMLSNIGRDVGTYLTTNRANQMRQIGSVIGQGINVADEFLAQATDELGSLPGGVMYSYQSAPAHYRKVEYLYLSNEFLIDDSVLYSPALPPDQVACAVAVVDAGQPLAFSVQSDQRAIVYGRVDPHSALSIYSIATDMIMGGALLLPILNSGLMHDFEDRYALPSGWVSPSSIRAFKGVGLITEIRDLGFETREDVLVSKGTSLNVHWYPPKTTSRSGYGFQPDLARVEELSRDPEIQRRTQQFLKNLKYFTTEPALQYAAEFSQLLGFIHMIKDSKIPLPHIARSAPCLIGQ